MFATINVSGLDYKSVNRYLHIINKSYFLFTRRSRSEDNIVENDRLDDLLVSSRYHLCYFIFPSFIVIDIVARVKNSIHDSSVNSKEK